MGQGTGQDKTMANHEIYVKHIIVYRDDSMMNYYVFYQTKLYYYTSIITREYTITVLEYDKVKTL